MLRVIQRALLRRSPLEGRDDTRTLDDAVSFGTPAAVTEPRASGTATKAAKKLAKKTHSRAASSGQEAMEQADNAVAATKRNPEIESSPTPPGGNLRHQSDDEPPIKRHFPLA